MAGLRTYVTSFVGIILLGFCLIAFIPMFISVRNPNSDLLLPKYHLNSTMQNLNATMANFTGTANGVYATLGSAQPSPVDFLFLIFQGAFYIPLAFLGFVFSGTWALMGVLFLGLSQGFGVIGIMIISLLSAVMIVTLVLLIVKAIRTGETGN